MQSATKHALSIQAPNRRVEIVDFLRGWALFGMLIVHFQYYVRDESLRSERVRAVLEFLATDRFYPLFALLFGVGFALQFQRWGERRGIVAIYLRRLSVLMLMAVALITTTGYRVLESYAFWAVPLLLVRRWSNRALLVLTLLSAVSRPLTQFAVWQWEQQNLTLEQSNARVQAESRVWPDFFREEERLRNEGTSAELVKLRLRHHFGMHLRWQALIPGDPIMMFLLGMLAVRIRLFQEPIRYRKLLTGIIVYGVLAGAATVALWDQLPNDPQHLRLNMIWRSLFSALVDARFLGIGYAAALVWWFARSTIAPKLFQLLATTGRLSLTNYVVQIAILESLFDARRSIGNVSRLEALGLVAVVYALQVGFSRWWMRRYRMGPTEWLWRSATYLQWQPLRLQSGDPEVLPVRIF